ncbi:uncharacterized protein LOC144634039 [Oculina patagonica]
MGKTSDYPVRNLISFDALENPSWHATRTCSNARQGKTVTEMITQIADYHKRWEQAIAENAYNDELVKKVQEQFLINFIFHVNIEEGHGLATLTETETFLRNCASQSNLTRSFLLEEQETINLRVAYENLLDKIKREELANDYGLMEVSLLEETHRLILQDIPLPKGFTKPGKMSNNPRVTEFKGEIYHYANPEDMESAVSNLLDKYNFLFDSCTKGKGGLKDFDDFYSLFKTCAWLLFELLDLHPFSDGNGRLCRILCSYVLSKLNPFPTPIYNVWTDSNKDDYINALVEARMSPERHPCALTTMIIECSYYGWQKFFKALDEESNHRTCVKEASFCKAKKIVPSSSRKKSESNYKHPHTCTYNLQCIPCSV